MTGISSCAAQHAGEELLLGSFPSSTAVEDSGSNEAPLQIPDSLPFQRPVHNALTALPVVVAIVFLLLSMYLCGLRKSDELGVRGRLRRLSGKGEEEGGKGAGSRMEEVCGMVEDAVSSQGAAQTAPSGPSPGAPQASEEERPRKKKRKTRRLEQELPPAARPPKKAREDPPSSAPGSFADEEEGMTKVIEEVVIEALESLGPEVEEWDLEFSEESLWVPSPAVTPEVPHEGSGESEGSPHPPENLPHLPQAAKQLQGEQQQGASSPSLEGSAFPSDSHPCSQLRQLLLKPHSRSGEGTPQGEAEPSTSGAFFPTESPKPGSSTLPTQLERHSFYRIPRTPVDAQISQFDGLLPFSQESGGLCLSEKLGILRELFAKETLRESDLRTLKSVAYSLIRHASRWRVPDFEEMIPSKAVEQAAQRFLVADGLWCVCAVVGPAMNPEQWWDRLMAHVTIPERAVNRPLFRGKYDWRPTIGRFRNAIEQYRRRQRPAAAEIVGLKREIFCNPRFYYKFRSHLWDSWREDDEEFERGSGASQVT